LGFALRKQESGAGPSAGVPLGKRLRAWWNGYDLPRQSAAAATPGRKVGKSRSAAPAAGGAPPLPANPWSETRRQLAQELWGAGFIVPGASAYVEKLVSGCALTEAETLLEIGTGMGGGARTIVGKFGNYVTGYERDTDLAEAARAHAVAYEIDEKLEVLTTPLDRVELKRGYFRAALLRDVLYTLEDKTRMIGRVSAALKPGESFLVITDFLFDAQSSAPALDAWKAVEDRAVYPWTEDALTSCLISNGITPRTVADESQDYRSMVIEGWSDYLRRIEGRDLPEGLREQLARDGEFWARRVAALEAGLLKYYRIEGVKAS